jgi:hypothetical protein
MGETDETAILVEALIEIVRMCDGDRHPRSDQWEAHVGPVAKDALTAVGIDWKERINRPSGG